VQIRQKGKFSRKDAENFEGGNPFLSAFISVHLWLKVKGETRMAYKFEKDLRYATSHEWVRIEDDIAIVGISDAAQDLLSDVVFVELPEVGEEVTAGDAIAVVESVKAAEDVNAPVSGVVVEINRELEDTPELVNDDPYGSWFFKIQPSSGIEDELVGLMDSSAYATLVEKNEH
jgi:glycine cleavage system H protein